MSILCILVVVIVEQKMVIDMCSNEDELNCIAMQNPGRKSESSFSKMVKITTRKQFECLVGLMDEYPEIAKGFYRSPNKSYLRDFWKQAAMKLNSLGPPVRDGEGWQRVWNDYKLKAKKKMLLNKQLIAKGAPPHRLPILNKLEETTIKLMCLDKVGSHQRAPAITRNQNPANEVAPLDECKVPSNADCEDVTNLLSESQLQCSSSDKDDIKPSTSSLKVEKQPGIDPQLEGEGDIPQNIYVSIAKSLKNIEDSSMETARIWQKILELKEEKLAIYKKNIEEKAEYRRQKQKLRQEKLGLKRFKLNPSNA